MIGKRSRVDREARIDRIEKRFLPCGEAADGAEIEKGGWGVYVCGL